MQVIFLSGHGPHHLHRRPHIVNGPVGIANLAGKTVGLDSVAELMGKFPPILIDREQIQLGLILQQTDISEFA